MKLLKLTPWFLVPLLVVLWAAGHARADSIQATATATVVPFGHDPADLAQIASLRHAVNSMLQQGCQP